MMLFVLGTRAEIIKCFPVMRELDKRKIEWGWIHTGQHNLESLKADLSVKDPIKQLDVTSFGQGSFFRGGFIGSVISATLWSLKNMLKLRKIFKKLKPSVILFQGDTMTCATAALAGRSILWKRPKLGHIEAGIRSHDIFEPFPEEISRLICDRTSDYLFAPTKRAVQNLKKEKVTGRIILTGQTGVDAVLHSLKKQKKEEDFVIVQFHRVETLNSFERMEQFVNIVNKIPYKVIYLIHGSGIQKLKETGLWNQITHSNITQAPLMDYQEYLSVLDASKGILTDSGGVLEDCSTLKKPCLVLRKKTERQEAIEAGFATIVLDKDPTSIPALFEKQLEHIKNPYGDGKASERIVDLLRD